MKRTAAICVAIVFSLVSPVHAIYLVTDTGTWPKSWPTELEPLRKQARTFEGPKQLLLHYGIPFTKRDEFESAWPHLLKTKSKGAPIVLRRGPSFWLGDKAAAGVCIHTPPAGQDPIADGKDAQGNWEKTIYIELIVDGTIIDLNRIPLPADTPIIDGRFPKTSAPTLKAEVTCYLGKLDSGTKVSCSTTSPGDPHGKKGSLRCGLNERISITKWSFLESRDGKDVYRFSRSFEADTTETPETKEIQFDGKRVIVFEDTAQVVVIQPPKQ